MYKLDSVAWRCCNWSANIMMTGVAALLQSWGRVESMSKTDFVVDSGMRNVIAG